MNARRNLLAAAALVALLALALTPPARWLSEKKSAGQGETAQDVQTMLDLLAASPARCAQTPVEPMLAMEDIWAIEDAREESGTPLVTGMRNGDHELGYDAESDTFYCTIGMEMGEDWPELTLFAQAADGAENLRVVWVDDYSYDFPADAVRDGWRYELLAYTDTEFAYFGVVFTGLPIVTLKIGGGAEALGEEYTAARVAVSGEGYAGVSSGALVHLRGGGYVKQYPKDSYRVELHTLSAHGDKKDRQSLLGMPEDSDWLLIANASDESCARNELAFGIWRDWNADGQAFMLLESRMVEVFVENEYVGLYQLMQRVREEDEIVRMGGNPATDYCARVVNVQNVGKRPRLDMVDSINMWVELRYAPQGVSTERAFAQFEPYWRMNTRTAEHAWWLDDETFARTAEACTDVHAMMDFFLFTQAAGLGYDNVFNNVFMWALWQGDHYVYYLSPWDMDMGFAKLFGGKRSGSGLYLHNQPSGNMPVIGAADDVEDTLNLYMQQARRMLDLDVAGSQQTMRDIWREKRATILTDDAMYQRFDAFEEMINASGAYLRETEKWHGGARELSLAAIQAFAVEHLHTIDRTIEELWPLDEAAN